MDKDTLRDLQRENRDIRHQQGQYVRGYATYHWISNEDDRYDDEEYIQLKDGSYSRVRE